jgi:acyl-CoA thioesterase-2
LTVEELDTDLYRGACAEDARGRVFGGQVIAQALASASRTVGEDRPAHSLHAYFLRAGDATRPIVFQVARDFNGGSFSNRRVVALQGGVPILNFAASFHRREEGLGHSVAMPDVPPPEQSIDLDAAMQASGAQVPPGLLRRIGAFETRIAAIRPEENPAAQYFWFRLTAPAPSDAGLHRVMLSFATDFALITAAVLPHGVNWFSTVLQGASLDHAIWIHEAPDLNDWLLYAMDSPWAGHARGFARGKVFDRAGRLIADVAQEGMMRVRSDVS